MASESAVNGADGGVMPVSELIRRRKVVEYQLPPHLQVGGGALLGGGKSAWLPTGAAMPRLAEKCPAGVP